MPNRLWIGNPGCATTDCCDETCNPTLNVTVRNCGDWQIYVSGTTVEILDENDNVIDSAITDSFGRATLNAPVEGEYLLKGTKSPDSAQKYIYMDCGVVEGNLSIGLNPSGVTSRICCQVVRVESMPGGEFVVYPVPGATVTVGPVGNPAPSNNYGGSGVTDANGFACINVHISTQQISWQLQSDTVAGGVGQIPRGCSLREFRLTTELL